MRGEKVTEQWFCAWWQLQNSFFSWTFTAALSIKQAICVYSCTYSVANLLEFSNVFDTYSLTLRGWQRVCSLKQLFVDFFLVEVFFTYANIPSSHCGFLGTYGLMRWFLLHSSTLCMYVCCFVNLCESWPFPCLLMH